MMNSLRFCVLLAFAFLPATASASNFVGCGFDAPLTCQMAHTVWKSDGTYANFISRYRTLIAQIPAQLKYNNDWSMGKGTEIQRKTLDVKTMQGELMVQVLLMFSNNSSSAQELSFTNVPDTPEKQFATLVLDDSGNRTEISLFEIIPGLSNEYKEFEPFFSQFSNEPIDLVSQIIIKGFSYSTLSPGQTGWIVLSFKVPKAMGPSIVSVKKMTAKREAKRIVLTLAN